MYHTADIILGGVCLHVSCTNLLSIKLSGLKQFALLLFTLISLLIFDPLSGQLTGLFVIATFLALICFWSPNKWLDLSCSLFGYLLVVSCNYIFIWIVQLLFQQSLDSLQNMPAASLIVSVIYCFLCYGFTKWLGIWLHKNLKLELFLTDEHLAKTIFLFLLLITILFLFNITIGGNIGYSYTVIAFNSIVFLTLFPAAAVLIWFLYQNILQKQQAKHMLEQYKHLQAYTSELEKLYNSQRRFKHDYTNILTTLFGYMEEGNLSELKRYFQQEILPVSREFTNSDTQLGKLSQIKQMELKSILSSKLMYALEKSISVELELVQPIEHISVNIVDFCRIMGIFLDNAIDAALEAKMPLIRLCFLQEPDHVIMMLQNSANPPSHSISSLSDLGISSKGEHRGIGLYNVKEILRHYPNILWEMKYEAPVFIQALTIFSEKGTCL